MRNPFKSNPTPPLPAWPGRLQVLPNPEPEPEWKRELPPDPGLVTGISVGHTGDLDAAEARCVLVVVHFEKLEMHVGLEPFQARLVGQQMMEIASNLIVGGAVPGLDIDPADPVAGVVDID